MSHYVDGRALQIGIQAALWRLKYSLRQFHKKGERSFPRDVAHVGLAGTFSDQGFGRIEASSRPIRTCLAPVRTARRIKRKSSSSD